MKRQLKLVTGLLCLGTMTQGVFAQDEGQLPVVNGKGSLTISGGDYWHREMYGDGERPSLSAYDSLGQLLPDGEYRYEFRTSSADSDSGSQQQALLNNQGQNGSQRKGKSRALNKVSGSFEVQGGQLVYP